MDSEKQTQEPDLSETAAEDTAPTPEGLVDSLAAVTAERDRIAAEKAELQDLLLRRQAEFENFRRRSERERAEFAEYAGAETVRVLLPILDDFERAMKAPSAGENGGLEYRKGIELIYQRLVDALRKTGLEPIRCEGQPFDPNLHQAVDRAETADLPDQTVLQVYQQGYNFKGRLLRPAMVKVAIAPSS